MRYVVKINSGGARTQSIPLPNKLRVSSYVKRSPVGRANTPIEVFDKLKKRTITGQKIKFYRTKW